MSFHPNPISMAMHVEHHRQELLEQAHQERLAKQAIAGGCHARHGWSEASTAAFGRARSVFARLRPALTDPMELSHSTPGEA